mmetsp:Transcript_66540/g.148529  ORF Transcript_66540/g.148529 Transcript_66540/m.148529 type:complete len:89 (+) Transcript_66540:663-929(+)
MGSIRGVALDRIAAACQRRGYAVRVMGWPLCSGCVVDWLLSSPDNASTLVTRGLGGGLWAPASAHGVASHLMRLKGCFCPFAARAFGL